MATTKWTLQREKIVEATRKVVRIHGLRASNLRLVAREAGVSPVSVLYYFETKEALFESAIKGILGEFYDARVELLSGIADPKQRLVSMIYAGIPDEVSEAIRGLLEVTAALPFCPPFQPFVVGIVEKQLNLYFTIIEIGVGLNVFTPRPDSLTVARNILALEDAFDLYPLIGLKHDRQQIRDGVIAYAELALNVDLTQTSQPLSTP